MNYVQRESIVLLAELYMKFGIKNRISEAGETEIIEKYPDDCDEMILKAKSISAEQKRIAIAINKNEWIPLLAELYLKYGLEDRISKAAEIEIKENYPDDYNETIEESKMVFCLAKQALI